jgi:hypothetical protein
MTSCSAPNLIVYWKAVYTVRYEILKALLIKIQVLREATPCHPVNSNRPFRRARCFHIRSLALQKIWIFSSIICWNKTKGAHTHKKRLFTNSNQLKSAMTELLVTHTLLVCWWKWINLLRTTSKLRSSACEFWIKRYVLHITSHFYVYTNIPYTHIFTHNTQIQLEYTEWHLCW